MTQAQAVHAALPISAAPQGYNGNVDVPNDEEFVLPRSEGAADVTDTEANQAT